MPILTHNTTIVDDDLLQLRQHFMLLDGALMPLMQKINRSPAVDHFSDYINRDNTPFERAEYIIGSGLVATQRYLNAARSSLALDQTTALATAPFWVDRVSFAQALHDGANYWKHHVEWRLDPHIDDIVKAQAGRTLLHLKHQTLWPDYTCSSLLFALTQDRNLGLSNLLPKLEIWRDHVMAMN